MLPRTTLRLCSERLRLVRHIAALALALALSPRAVLAHDPDTWGGLFRSHDAGATWMPVSPGIFTSGALALAVSPRDPNHLLLATDSGMWRSRNGGRDWDVEAPDILTGPAFAAAFDADGARALVAGPSTLFRHDGDRWRPLAAPVGAMPARALVAASVLGRVYLVGKSGLYRSDDWGGSWTNIGSALQGDHVDSLIAPSGRPEEVYAVAGGAVWSSRDAGRGWQLRCDGSAADAIEVVGPDSSDPARLWAVGGGQVLRSDRQGERWRGVGKPIPEGPATARAVAVSGHVILIATDRGVFRSVDAGGSWEPPKEGLPAHLAAGVLTRDPRNPSTVYAGFAVAQYADLLPRVPQTGGAFGGVGWMTAVGGVVILLLLALSAIVAVQHLVRTRVRPDPNGARSERRSVVSR